MSQKKTEKTDSSNPLWKILITLSIIMLITLLWLSQKKSIETKKQDPVPAMTLTESIPKEQAPEEPIVSDAEIPKMDILKGKWLRPDGGYIIEISKIDDTGTLAASYFNPRPIHVAQAQASTDEGKLIVFIKLQDQGYPGSTYTLTYHSENDVLTGVYYQAAYQQNFDVIFTRMKE